jgi:hypothetical protein
VLPLPRLRRRAALALAPLAVAAALAGCSATVSVEAADAANEPDCAAVTTRLPQSVDGQQRRWTDAQASGAWGSPAAVVLRCGVAEPGPTTLPCESAGGVDWIIDDAEAPNFRFTTYGRSPAVEVYLDYDEVSARSVLDALGSAVSTLPTTGAACTARADATPTPAG